MSGLLLLSQALPALNLWVEESVPVFLWQFRILILSSSLLEEFVGISQVIVVWSDIRIGSHVLVLRVILPGRRRLFNGRNFHWRVLLFMLDLDGRTVLEVLSLV